ncbi:hypothetical protein JCM10450v2_007358 [Rhodotorula kratochvilovae]
MHPTYKFPRSHGSLDLTDPSSVPPPSAPSGSQSHPSLLITDSSGHAQDQTEGMTDAQYLAKFTSATNALLDGPGAPDPAHLSTTLYPSKTLSRISEYSESAYSSVSRSRDSQEPPSSPPRSEISRSPSPGVSPIDPAFGGAPASFSFPAPPTFHAAHLSAQAPPLIPVTTPTSPRPAPSQRLTVANPDASSPLLSTPGSASPAPPITRHHLPSRPLTTPLPLANPAPVPVPLDNFAAPPSHDRADSPQWSVHSPDDAREYMVQLPGRAVLPGGGGARGEQRLSRHAQENSQASTVWATAEDEKFFGASGEAYAGAYDAASLVGSGSAEGTGTGSSNRFTLDDEKIGVGRDLQQRSQRRKGSDASTATGTQGWEPEQEQPRKGANRRLLWGFTVLLVIGVAVGVGVGVGKKQSDERHSSDSLAAASSAASSSSSASAPSSTAPSSSLRSIIRPSATSASASPTAPTTFSTTFAYAQSGRSTVVPLTYTIPSSYSTRADGRYQFTEPVVLPNLGSAGGSFTSELRFRVAPTAPAATAVNAARRERRELGGEAERSWDRHAHARERRARAIR